MALSSSSIAAKVSRILQDVGFDRWTVANLATWINLATKDLVLLKPTALTASVAMLLAVSSTKQSLVGATFKNTVSGDAATVTSLQLLDMVRNMGATGIESAAGSAITRVERQALDMMLPGWHGLTPEAEIRSFVFDPKDPLNFYVYRKAPATAHYVELVVSREPVNTLEDDASAFADNDIDAGLSEIYESALVDATLARAFSEDSENPDAAARAASHYRAFASALGVKLQNEVGISPSRRVKAQPSQSAQ